MFVLEEGIIFHSGRIHNTNTQDMRTHTRLCNKRLRDHNKDKSTTHQRLMSLYFKRIIYLKPYGCRGKALTVTYKKNKTTFIC